MHYFSSGKFLANRLWPKWEKMSSSATVSQRSTPRMDGLQLCSTFLSSCFNRFIDGIQNHSNNIIEKWKGEEPDGDYFWLADIVTAVAAIRFDPKNQHQRIICKIWRAVLWYQCVYVFLKALENIITGEDFGTIVLECMFSCEALMCFVKEWLLIHNWKNITEARRFINQMYGVIRHESYDTCSRKQYYRMIRATGMGLTIITFFEAIFLLLPSASMDEMFGPPEVFCQTPVMENVSYYLLRLTMSPIWTCRILSTTVVVASILLGFKNEFDIFAHGFEKIIHQVKYETDKFFTTSRDSSSIRHEELFFEFLEKHVYQYIKYHVELLKHLQQFKPLVEILFFMLYYQAMLLMAAYSFLILRAKLTIASVMISTAVVTYFIKCYMWCFIVDSIQDTVDGIEDNIMALITIIPHTMKYNSRYNELRTALMIMKIQIRTSAQFTCGQMFVISIEVFEKLLKTTYSLFTFLLNAEHD